MDRGKRTVLAVGATVVWLGYMGIGLSTINTLLPTHGGEGPEGAAAFMGLVGGVIVIGLIMWAVSD